MFDIGRWKEYTKVVTGFKSLKKLVDWSKQATNYSVPFAALDYGQWESHIYMYLEVICPFRWVCVCVCVHVCIRVSAHVFSVHEKAQRECHKT